MHLSWRRLDVTVHAQVESLIAPIEYASASLVGSKIFMYGGIQVARRLSELYVFDIQAQSWEKIVNPDENVYIPQRGMHTSVLVEDEILIYGGMDSMLSRKLFAFDLILHTFQLKEVYGHDPPRLGGHSSEYFAWRQAMMVFAGMRRPSKCVVYEYDVVTSVWRRVRTRGRQPSRRFKQGSVTVGRNWYLYGGQLLSGGQEARDLYILDVSHATPVWTEVMLPQALPTRAPMVHYNGVILLFERGRLRRPCVYDIESREVIKFKEEVTSDNENGDISCDGEEKRYTVDAMLPRDRVSFMAVANQRSVFIFGGSNGATITVYELEADTNGAE